MRLSGPPVSQEISDGDADYPQPLRNVEPRPARFHWRGVAVDFSRAVSIVGTRKADDDGLEFARTLAETLARRGVVIVSGGAFGIDAAAHEGALAGNGRTVAVLGTSVDDPHPRHHRSLFERTAESGALLSTLGPRDPVRRTSFLERNRWIAALGAVTIVVQAPIRSGALSTAAHAKALAKPVLAVPWAPSDPRGAGCHFLIKEGARICTSVEDVLSVAPFGVRQPADKAPCSIEKPSDFLDVDEDGRAVWAAMSNRATHLDDIARKTGLPVQRVQRSVLMLLLRGHLVDRGGGQYRRVS